MQNRRRVISWLLGGSTGLALGVPMLEARGETRRADPWLDDLAVRKQKAFLDVPAFHVDGTPFRRTNALLTALSGSHGIAPADIGVAFGAHNAGLAYLFPAEIWLEFDVLSRVAATLRPDDAMALRALGPAGAAAIGATGVKELRAKGVRVLACRNTMGRWARDAAATQKGNPEVMLQKLVAGLHEGVEPVPAMIAAAVLAQARGLGYVSMH